MSPGTQTSAPVEVREQALVSGRASGGPVC